MSFIDPGIASQVKEREGRLPFVYPKEFYTKYREQPDGSQKPEDWVLVAKKGMASSQQETPMRWRDVERTPALAEVLSPYYKNWKAGQEGPINGTPLEAWMADPALIKVLAGVNIRSVEDFVELPDHLMVRLNVPGLRDKQARAKAYLDSKRDSSGVSAELAVLREQVQSQARENAELKALIERFAIKKEEEQAPKRRGRPPKIKPEETQ